MRRRRNNYRRRRKWRKGRVCGLIAILAVIIIAAFVFVRAGNTKYESVNKGLGQYVVKANEGLLDENTGKQFKKNLYVPRKLDKSKKLIAFTFDDGPRKGNTERILAALDKYNFRATFFMLGQNVKLYPDTVKKVYKSGNEVSGHSWNHPQLTKLTKAQIKDQYDRMNQAIYAACKSKAASFRPPYGAVNENVKQVVDKPLILWSVDTLDWKTLNTNATVNAILKNAKDGDIILMHDIHAPTVAAVEKVLPKLKKEGFEVCTVSELLEAKGVKVKKGDKVFSATDIIHDTHK